MSILEALNGVPSDKWKLQSLQSTFRAGTVNKKGATITFETEPELVFQMNAAAMAGGKVKTIGMVIWVDAEAWEEAQKRPTTFTGNPEESAITPSDNACVLSPSP